MVHVILCRILFNWWRLCKRENQPRIRIRIAKRLLGGTKRPHQSFSSGSSDDGKRAKKDEDDEGVRDRKKDDEGVQDGKKDDDELLMEDNDSDTYVGEEDGLADKESDEYRLSKWLKDNEQLDTDAINLINVEDLSLLNSGGRPPET